MCRVQNRKKMLIKGFFLPNLHYYVWFAAATQKQSNAVALREISGEKGRLWVRITM